MSHFEDVTIQTLMREAIETAKDSEWIEAVPRHPDYINPNDLPSVGGG